jgi:hypothetical protein
VVLNDQFIALIDELFTHPEVSEGCHNDARLPVC